MTAAGGNGAQRNWKLISLLLVGIGVIALTAANVHLVYVAVTSQTACVPHAKSAGAEGAYRAAKSAC